MLWKLTLTGDYYEDSDELKSLANHKDICSVLWEARQLVRSRLKYTEDLSDEEDRFLEQLSDLLYIQGVE